MNRQDELYAISRVGDKVLLGTLTISAVLAVAIGNYYGQLAFAVLAAGILLTIGGVTVAFFHGTRSAVGLAFANAAMVALHIQLGRGTIEFHFGVFALLALVLVYRDWRPLIATATFFAIHHILFDRLQALGYGTFCVTEPNLLRVIGHAGYVVAQTSVEIFIAVILRKAAIQSAELKALISKVADGKNISLDVRELEVRSPEGKALAHTLEMLQSAMSSVSGVASSLEKASKHISQSNQHISDGTSQASQSIGQITQRMRDITQEVSGSEKSASQAEELAQLAASGVNEGAAIVNHVTQKMKRIQVSSKSISDITQVIDSISFQTNILALNAAVEASRAGEDGRGFAVVATEVRSLAARSSAAAKEIRQLIEASVLEINEGADLAQKAGTSMNGIVQSIDHVKTSLDDIVTRTKSQRAQIVDIHNALNELTSSTDENVKLVKATNEGAELLVQQAEYLNATVNRFDLGGMATTKIVKVSSRKPADGCRKRTSIPGELV